MNQPEVTIITDSKIVLSDGTVREGAVIVEQGIIKEIASEAPGHYLLHQDNVQVISGKGCFLTPGLIELHFNGGLGCNFNTAPIKPIQNLLDELPRFGITSALLTAISAPLEDMMKTVQTLEEVNLLFEMIKTMLIT